METHARAKLTDAKVNLIFALREQGLQYKDIAEQVQISQSNVSMILSGNRWGHLTDLKHTSVKKPRLTAEMKANILYLKNQGLMQKEIAAELNINQSTVSRTLRGVSSHV